MTNHETPQEVVVHVPGEIRVVIVDGKVTRLVLIPYEGDAGYMGDPSHILGTTHMGGALIYNEDVRDEDRAKAQRCLDEGMPFPEGDFPEWVTWVV